MGGLVRKPHETNELDSENFYGLDNNKASIAEASRKNRVNIDP
jgi:hypothetical protein